jgi:CheY-like chemotaxis protein
VAEERQQLVDMLSAEEVSVKSVASGQEALEAMHNERFDCVILDLNLPDISGFEVLQKMAADSRFKNIPVVVYTARDLSRRDLNKLEKLARTVVVKGDDSVERLLAETSLFLHRVNSDLPQAGLRLRQHSADDGTEQQRYHNEVVLEGRKLLIVDDDARNLFALTSLLERRKMEVVTAESGQEAIDLLLSASGVEIVLMDIMLPEMDGYDTIREIRKHSHLRELPIIALTAKAMKGDREKCLEAGASDYVAKPVNVEQLLSLLRVWLHR